MPTRANLSSRVRLGGLVRLVCFGIILLPIMGAVSAEAAQNFLNVKVENLADCVQITVIGNEPILCSIRHGTSFVAADIRGMTVPRASRMRIMSGHIWKVRFGPFSSGPTVSRIAISTKSSRPYTTCFSDDKRQMILKAYKLGYPKAEQQEKTTASVPDKVVKTATIGAKPLAKESEAAPKALEPPKVVVTVPLPAIPEKPKMAAEITTQLPSERPTAGKTDRSALSANAKSSPIAETTATKPVAVVSTAKTAANTISVKPTLPIRSARGRKPISESASKVVVAASPPAISEQPKTAVAIPAQLPLDKSVSKADENALPAGVKSSPTTKTIASKPAPIPVVRTVASPRPARPVPPVRMAKIATPDVVDKPVAQIAVQSESPTPRVAPEKSLAAIENTSQVAEKPAMRIMKSRPITKVLAFRAKTTPDIKEAAASEVKIESAKPAESPIIAQTTAPEKPSPRGSVEREPAIGRTSTGTSRSARAGLSRTDVLSTVDSVSSDLPTQTVALKPRIVPPIRDAVAVKAAAPPALPIEPRNINLDFVGADINEVLKALSIQSGRNIVVSKDVAGQVTVTLNKVSFVEALDYITKLSGYRYAKSSNTYVVGTASGLSALLGYGENIAGTATEVIPIRYADPDEISKAISQQVPGVKCSAGAYSSGDGKKGQQLAKVLMISGPTEDVEIAKKIVTKVEESLSEGREGYVTEVYRIKYADADSLLELVSKLNPEVTVTRGPTDGFDLTAPTGTPIGSASSSAAAGSGAQAAPVGGQGQQLGRTGLLVLSGSKVNVQEALRILDRVDQKPIQILIEAKVTDLRISAQKRLGLSWNWSSFGLIQRTGALDALQNPVSVSGTLHHTPVSIESVLDASLTNGDATLLANPRVAALEGKPAVIFIGDEIRYVINVQQTQQGQNITTETANVGIQLRVIADVSPDEYITLNLHPEVSVISSYLRIGTGAGGTDITLPQIARRYTDSVVRVKNGETIVIGGLIRDQDIKNISKVPFLGDLPFFGELFTKRDKSKEHSEIVVFITCSLLPD